MNVCGGCEERLCRRKSSASMRIGFDVSFRAFKRPGMSAEACTVRLPGSVETSWRKQWNAAVRVLDEVSLSCRAAALTTRGTSKDRSLKHDTAPPSMSSVAEEGATSRTASLDELAATCVSRSLNVAATAKNETRNQASGRLCKEDGRGTRYPATPSDQSSKPLCTTYQKCPF